MKKTVSLLLAVSILLALLPGASCADSVSVKFKPVFTNQVKATAAQWYSTETNRAALTVALCADVFYNKGTYGPNDIESYLTNPTYVGLSQNKNQLLVMGYYGTETEFTILVIVYTPSRDEIEYTEMKLTGSFRNQSTADAMEGVLYSAMQSMNSKGQYEKNNPDLVLEQYKKVSE